MGQSYVNSVSLCSLAHVRLPTRQPVPACWMNVREAKHGCLHHLPPPAAPAYPHGQDPLHLLFTEGPKFICVLCDKRWLEERNITCGIPGWASPRGWRRLARRLPGWTVWPVDSPWAPPAAAAAWRGESSLLVTFGFVVGSSGELVS